MMTSHVISSLRKLSATTALLIAIAAYPGVAGAQMALRLGPTNTTTYVTFGATSALGLATFTVETWFNRQGTGVATSTGSGGLASFVPLVTKGAAQGDASNVDADYVLGINTAGNVIAADFEEGGAGTSPGLNHPLSGVTPVVNNTWYHAAVTYDGTTLRLYLNGEVEAELVVGQPTRSDSIQHAALGTTLTSTGTPSGFFDGTLDEARIWNVARTQAQIRATINTQNPSDGTLVARWGLDETSGTTVNDSAGTPQNGTITGTSFSRVANAPFDILTCAGNASSMIRLDGVNDYVALGNPAELGLTSFTIETWFKREGVGVGNTTGAGGIGGTGGPPGSLVPLITKGAPEADGSNLDANYIFGINTTGNVLAADFEEGPGGPGPLGANHPIVGVTAITDNNWHHAAATYSTATRDWRLYLDGALEVSAIQGAGVVPRSDSLQPAALGTMLTSTSTRLGAFAGVLDEVRIWNVARTQAQIQADMSNQLTSGTGLVARWGLGEGTGTTAADSVAPASNGTLTNGPVWTASSSLFDATAACSDGAFCNGADTCSGIGANGLRCTTHAGDPCTAGAECNNVCNETLDNCAVTAGTPCTNDGNACTDDQCNGAGACTHPNNTAPCNDGSACTTVDVCAGGTCVGSIPPNCDDGNVCTTDGCNPASGCTHANNTVSCSDGSACTVGDTCSGGTCVAGPPPNCDDGNVCTTDGCNPASGCTHTNNTAPCSDGSVCTVGDTCAGGVCVPGGSLNCNDGNPCTDDSCNPVTGCVATNNTASCSDGNACTTGDVCSGGSCVGGPPLVCNDGNPCTDDSCNPATGCVATNNAASCSDGNVCTTGDVCSGGSCVGGPPLVCNDGNPCTDDQCNPTTGCFALNNAAPCDDGNACTTADTCAGGSCMPGAPLSCNDGNVCTDDGCNPASGCTHANNSAPCSDGSACTTGDLCAGGACVGGPPANCDDGNVCTDDACNPASGCTHANNSAPCNDGSQCTTADTCAGGACVGGPPPDCNDGNVCTDDACNPASGCTHTNNTASCDDANGCTSNDACAGGTCQGGPPTVCDDGNACTADSCSSPSGCQHTAIAGCCNTNAQCADTDLCTTNERCVAHACVSDPVSCNDGNPCTDDGCNPPSGCLHVPNNLPCSDGDACTTADACSGGACIGGPPPNCNDGNPCTDDACNPAGGCTHTNNTAPCSDGSFCTTGDTCSAGSCVGGPPSNCNDGNPCTDDACNPSSGCTHTNNALPCSDGAFCTVGDVCAGGACTGTPRDCNSAGDQCHTGTCDEGLDQCVGPAKPNGSPCNDGDVCTTGETCTSGSCGGGTPTVCAACETCDATGGCQVGPRTDCRASIQASSSKLAIYDKTPDTALVSWKWSKGDATSVEDLGDPLVTTDYTLCIFDQNGLAVRATAPAGDDCGAKPCWKALGLIGFKYSDKDRTPEGVLKLLLKSGDSGRAKARIKAKGSNIPIMALPLAPPVTAQLQAAGNACLESTHSASSILRNEDTVFKAKSD